MAVFGAKQGKNYSELWAILTVVFVSVALMLPILVFGPPNGSNLIYNLSWHQGFSEQVLSGNLYPRWLPQMNVGAGSPIFYFYPPLAFWLAVPANIFCQECSNQFQFALGLWILIGLSGLTSYALFRTTSTPVFAAVGAVVYMALPYHYEIDLWTRQSIGELAIYVVFPLCVWSTINISSRNLGFAPLAVSYAALVFAHLGSAALLTPILCIIFLATTDSSRIYSDAKVFALGLAIGFGLSCVYVLPALAYRDFIFADHWLSKDLYQYDNWYFLDGKPAPDPAFGNRLFLVLTATTVMFAMCVWLASTAQKSSYLRKYTLAWVGSVIVAWVFMTPISKPIWEIFSFLKSTQFPWRIAPALDIALAAMIPIALTATFRASNSLRQSTYLFMAMALLVLAGSGLWLVRNHLDFSKTDDFLQWRDSVIDDGRDAPEYTPKWSGTETLRDGVVRPNLQNVPFLVFDQSAGSVSIDCREPPGFCLRLELLASTTIQVKQFYFPTWKAKMNSGELLELRPSADLGLLEFDAPAGSYVVRLSLSTLKWEKQGQWISIGSLLFVFGSLVINWRYRRRASNRMADSNLVLR